MTDPQEFDLATVCERVATTVPDRALLSWRGRQWTHRQVADRARRLAAHLHAQGLGCHTERADLAGHEVGQDLLGIYAHNGNQWIETMLGCFRSRVAPFNVNYRYVEDELRYVLDDAGATALVYQAAFAPMVAQVREALPRLRVLVQIDDGSGQPLLDGAVDYETALAESTPGGPPVEPSPDDLYVIYTGGTTGMPKAVLWRQHDAFIAAMGGRSPQTWQKMRSYEEVCERVAIARPSTFLVLPPLMHGAAQWAAFNAITNGGTVVFPDQVDRLDAADALRTVEREGVSTVLAIGDAMTRPIIEELERGGHDARSLAIYYSAGAALTPALKERLIKQLPGLIVADSAGASETGAQMIHVSTKGSIATGTFSPSPDTLVIDAGLSRLARPDDEPGWLTQVGSVPLGYLGDPDKTAATFPVIDGRRHAVPGDRARLLADGSIQLLGRDAATINTGGEKVFAEEVEMALASHPSVRDVVVTSRPSERWGQEVVAIVALANGDEVDTAAVVDHAGRSIARYKLPKHVIVRPTIQRSPSGKADYRWARAVAADLD